MTYIQCQFTVKRGDFGQFLKIFLYVILPVFFTTNASFSECITMVVPVSNLFWIPVAALLHRVYNNTSICPKSPHLKRGDFGHMFFSRLNEMTAKSKSVICIMLNEPTVSKKNFSEFCHIILNQVEKTVLLEYDVIKRWLSILLWCKNIFEVAQDRGLEWHHEKCETRDFVHQYW